jgi:hypothetical protein
MTKSPRRWLLTVMPGRIAIWVEPPLLADLLAQHLAGRSWEVAVEWDASSPNGGHFDLVLYTGHLPSGLRAPVTMRVPGETGISPVTVRRRGLRSRTVAIDGLDDLVALIDREINHSTV